ncbi:hypothetical protein MKW94_017570 [Papaver nudicaule]|uniref:Uncharacterized protein n=1 Tax=Papaver nudicaule TaxID=74823 RepID=A0AA41UYA9_PAPNU|nr:hypothetical protein [Papaver nudicaule]
MGVCFRSRIIIIIFFIFLRFCSSSNKVSCVPNTNSTSILCDSGHNYINISAFPNAFAYGHATYSFIFESADCITCLVVAIQSVTKSKHYGATSHPY